MEGLDQKNRIFKLKAHDVIKTVLVVDDEEDIISIYCEILGRLGYSVLPAENGKKARRGN